MFTSVTLPFRLAVIAAMKVSAVRSSATTALPQRVKRYP
jgi:hypothetical protein